MARNHPDDVARLIWLFSYFGDVNFMKDVIVLWAEANGQIEKLAEEGEFLHARIVTGHPDTAAIELSVKQVERINLRLDSLEKQGSVLLSNASRTIRELLLWFTLATATALTGIGSVIARLMLKKEAKYQNVLRISEERLDLAIRSNNDGVWDWDIVTRSIYYSPRMKEIMGEGNSKTIFPSQHFFQYVHPEDLDAMQADMETYLRDHSTYDSEFRITTPTGEERWVRARGQSVQDSTGNAVRMAGSMCDITWRKQGALELTLSNRALHMLSRCKEVVNRAANEEALLLKICSLLVDIGGYRMAWVGYVQHDAARTVVPAGQAGNHDDVSCLSTSTLRWDQDDLEDEGALGRSIRSGAAVRFDDITHLLALAQDGSASEAGSYCGICLPLRDKETTFGVLVLTSHNVLFLSAEERKLLGELADDLAFGLISIRARHAQQRMQCAVLKIAAGVSASTGMAFFQHLVHNMAEALGACAVFVSRLSPTASDARTIAGVINGNAIDNFDYLIASSPCDALLKAGSFIVENNFASCYPLPPQMRTLAPQCYVGRRLDNSAGRPIGLLFVLFKEELKNSEFVISTLQIFAARAAAEMERQETDAHVQGQAALLDKAQDAIIVRDMDNRIQYWNKSAERLYGWSQDEAIGGQIQHVIFETPAAFTETCERLIAQGEWRGEIVKKRKDGSTLTVESRWTLMRDETGQPQSVLAIDTDITERKKAELEIAQLAFYDPLTQLANRRRLMDRLQQALATNAGSKHTGALLFIDLDNFKSINDTHGHELGDLLLRQVALRLISSVRGSDTVARLGGDEFVVMLPDLDGASHAEAEAQASTVAEKILATLSASYLIAGNEHFSTASIGLTLFLPQDCVGDMLGRADLAMYQAKAAGRNTLRFFDPQLQAAINASAALEADLRHALTREEFLLHYQTQVDGDGHITGVEALLRWCHPHHGVVAPAEFIPQAEQIGLILPLGLWVLATACAQLAAWARRAETAHLTMAVNVSVRQFAHPDFVAQINAVLAHTGANPLRLKLEITESLMVHDIAETIAKMTELKSKGVSFSLDDFGTGYSSLMYLKRLPLDQVKIDKSFVKDLLTDANDVAIARAIVALAQSMSLTVIAEGVETEAQRRLLAHLGCHACQGYLFSRPLPIDRLEDFMRENRSIGQERVQCVVEPFVN